MGRPVFVVVDSETEYIQSFEGRLVETFGNNADVLIFDERAVVEQFLLSEPHIDLLIVSERLFDPRWRKTGAGAVIVLTEDKEDRGGRDNGMTYIYKYTNLQKLLSEIEYAAGRFVKAADRQSRKTKIALVYSAAGGAGKTAIALSICSCLAENHKKVLYIDAENLQDFGFYLQKVDDLPSAAVNALGQTDRDIYAEIKPHLGNQGFDYIPPLRMTASSMGIEPAAFGRAAEEFARHAEYDHIIIDTDSLFDERKDNLIRLADRVIMLADPSRQSGYKTKKLLENIKGTENGKFLFVCNRCQNAQAVADLQSRIGRVDATVRELPRLAEGLLPTECEEIEKISYLL